MNNVIWTAMLALVSHHFMIAQSRKACPPVTAKNPQEAMMMEQSSNKKGCWQRSAKTGRLEFVNDAGPNDYKPLMNDRKPTVDSDLPFPPPQSAGDLIGHWDVTYTNANPLSRGYWEKGILAVTPTLGLQWTCQSRSAFDSNTVTWSSRAGACLSKEPSQTVGDSTDCPWSLTKVTPGTYRVKCGTGETFVRGTIVVQSDSINGKVVDDSDPYNVQKISFSGRRKLP